MNKQKIPVNPINIKEVIELNDCQNKKNGCQNKNQNGGKNNKPQESQNKKDNKAE